MLTILFLLYIPFSTVLNMVRPCVSSKILFLLLFPLIRPLLAAPTDGFYPVTSGTGTALSPPSVISGGFGPAPFANFTSSVASPITGTGISPNFTFGTGRISTSPLSISGTSDTSPYSSNGIISDISLSGSTLFTAASLHTGPNSSSVSGTGSASDSKNPVTSPSPTTTAFVSGSSLAGSFRSFSSGGISVNTLSTAIGTPYFGPVITTMVTIISGTTESIPVLIGGDLTSPVFLATPVLTTIDPTGSEAKASATEFSSQIGVLFPLIDAWISDPQPARATEISDKVDGILVIAADFAAKLPKDSSGSDNSCGNRRRDLSRRSFLGGLFKSLVQAVTCIAEDVAEVRKDIIDGVEDAVRKVASELAKLKPEIGALKDIDPEDGKNPSNSQSDSASSTGLTSKITTSSSSCTVMYTVTDFNILCTTTTTMLGRRAQGAVPCNTAYSTRTVSCSGSGVTSISTVTTTSSVIRCAYDCPACNAGSVQVTTPTPSVTCQDCLTGTNGIHYLPPEIATVTSSLLVTSHISNSPEQAATPYQRSEKRALIGPQNYDNSAWIFMVEEVVKGKRVPQPQGGSALTDRLLTVPDRWTIVDLFGCTSIIVTSRKRVWISHFWEEPTFTEASSRLTEDVLDPLINGNLNGNTPGLEDSGGPAKYAGSNKDFAITQENNVKVTIITPRNRGMEDPGEDDLEFNGPINSIKERLKTLLSLNEDPKVFSYKAFDEDLYLKDTTLTGDPKAGFPQGKVLMQYDPTQFWWLDENRCPIQRARLEIWLEDRPEPIYRDDWTALASQYNTPPPIPDNKNRKRDGGSCPIHSSGGLESSSGWSPTSSQTAAQAASQTGSSGASELSIITIQTTKMTITLTSQLISEPTNILASPSSSGNEKNTDGVSNTPPIIAVPSTTLATVASSTFSCSV